jgi:phosphoserine aminotransferase
MREFMPRVYNFSAGPAMLADEVLEQAQAEMLDWHGLDLSIMEVGHRGQVFKEVADKAEVDFRELMAIPDNYAVLFLAGGGTAHFSMVPMNLLGAKTTADYLETGVWSKKASEEARRYGTINVAASSRQQDGLWEVPPQNEWNLNPDAAFVHYTPNETIDGIEFNWVPDTGSVPLVADMSSMIMSRPIDVSQYGIIYACAQKNLGQAGISVAAIRKDLLQEPLPFTPVLYNYKLEVENGSMYNTPPTYSWYIMGLVFEWMKQKGGVKYFTELNKRKAKKLYAAVDGQKDFYINRVHPDFRSLMNVPFDLPNPELTEKFLHEAHHAGLVNLKGHRLAGGIRASIYNAMPEEGVDALVEYMKEFARKFG